MLLLRIRKTAVRALPQGWVSQRCLDLAFLLECILAIAPFVPECLKLCDEK